MRFKTLLMVLVSSALLCGCDTKFKHYDLPNNNLYFSQDGGSVEYVSPYGYPVRFEYVSVDGVKFPDECLMDDSKFIGYDSGWVRFIYGQCIGLDGHTYIIEIQPNALKESRSAIIHVGVSATYYSEINIHQEGSKTSLQ